MPSDLPTVESETETSNNDYGLSPESNLNDTVYDEHSDMSSFMPAPSLKKNNKKQEEDAVRQQFSSSLTVSWPTLDSEPLSEFATLFLATFAFPTLFPDGQGNPTNLSLMRNQKWEMVLLFCNAPKVFILGSKYDTMETSFRASIFFY